ncbi:MAG: hypothetical protein Q9162_005303 [Coniocarpon cinnabarinum]
MDRPILSQTTRRLARQTRATARPGAPFSPIPQLRPVVRHFSRPRFLLAQGQSARPRPFICEGCRLAMRIGGRRHLSLSMPKQHTALLNPRYGENGQEMTLEVTPRAAHRLSQIREKDKNPNLALRVTVESGGCHGFQYLMSLSDLNADPQHPSPEDSGDTVFEGANGAKVVLDESSLELLHGSKIDFTMELIGSQFKITGNPRASSSCGCGTSFDVNMD